MGNSTPGSDALHQFVTAIGGTDIECNDAGQMFFVLSGFGGVAYIKKGGTRVRGRIYYPEAMPEPIATKQWIDRQPPPESAVLELVSSGEDDGEVIELTLLFERSLAARSEASDPLLTDAADYFVSWYDNEDVGELLDPSSFRVPGDPRDLAPSNAWLLMGSEASFPTERDRQDDGRYGDVGVFDTWWTTAKQTEEGDLALFYFTSPRKAAYFIARAASRAFYDDTVEVVADGKVANEQWWAFFTPLIEIEPIPFATLRKHSEGHLLLRGRSGHYLRPETIASLPIRAKHSRDQHELDRILVTPVGRADLPAPSDITVDQWPHLASGAMPREANVSECIVEPLLRFALKGTDLVFEREYPVGRKSADYVVLNDGRPTCVVEVKLAIRESSDGIWAHSKDFQQMRGYATELECPGVLIDANRVLLFAQSADEPYRVIERRNVNAEDLQAMCRHLTTETGRPHRRAVISQKKATCTGS